MSNGKQACSVSSPETPGRNDALGELVWTACVIEALGDGPARTSEIARRMKIKLDADYFTNRDAIRHTLSRLERQGRVSYAHHTTPRIKTWKLQATTEEAA